MSKNSFLDCKSAAKHISKTVTKLYKESPTKKSSGFQRNSFGTYWKSALIESLDEAYEYVCKNSPDENDRFAACYSRAAFLRNVLRLEEAKHICLKLLAERPSLSAPINRLLSEVEARAGNLESAKLIASRISVDKSQSHYSISENDLIEEYTKGQEDRLLNGD